MFLLADGMLYPRGRPRGLKKDEVCFVWDGWSPPDERASLSATCQGGSNEYSLCLHHVSTKYPGTTRSNRRASGAGAVLRRDAGGRASNRTVCAAAELDPTHVEGTWLYCLFGRQVGYTLTDRHPRAAARRYPPPRKVGSLPAHTHRQTP